MRSTDETVWTGGLKRREAQKLTDRGCLTISCGQRGDGLVCKSALPSVVSLATLLLEFYSSSALARLSRTHVTLADVHSLSDGPAACPPL